jgi:hypothetical protein
MINMGRLAIFYLISIFFLERIGQAQESYSDKSDALAFLNALIKNYEVAGQQAWVFDWRAEVVGDGVLCLRQNQKQANHFGSFSFQPNGSVRYRATAEANTYDLSFDRETGKLIEFSHDNLTGSNRALISRKVMFIGPACFNVYMLWPYLLSRIASNPNDNSVTFASRDDGKLEILWVQAGGLLRDSNLVFDTADGIQLIELHDKMGKNSPTARNEHWLIENTKVDGVWWPTKTVINYSGPQNGTNTLTFSNIKKAQLEPNWLVVDYPLGTRIEDHINGTIEYVGGLSQGEQALVNLADSANPTLAQERGWWGLWFWGPVALFGFGLPVFFGLRFLRSKSM